MVSSPGRSSPAAYTQRQVDEMARGEQEHPAAIRRTPTRTMPGAEHDGDASGSRPVDLSAKELEEIRRSGRPSASLTRRIAAAERPSVAEARDAEPGRSKQAAKKTSAPGLTPAAGDRPASS
jgi:hypothetical protein